jgi:hypothetical protein
MLLSNSQPRRTTAMPKVKDRELHFGLAIPNASIAIAP